MLLYFGQHPIQNSIWTASLYCEGGEFDRRPVSNSFGPGPSIGFAIFASYCLSLSTPGCSINAAGLLRSRYASLLRTSLPTGSDQIGLKLCQHSFYNIWRQLIAWNFAGQLGDMLSLSMSPFPGLGYIPSLPMPASYHARSHAVSDARTTVNDQLFPSASGILPTHNFIAGGIATY